MTLIAVVEAVALVAVVLILARQRDDAERSWTVERRELLNRIQHPTHLPTNGREPVELPEPEPDDYDKVGTIVYAEDDTSA